MQSEFFYIIVRTYYIIYIRPFSRLQLTVSLVIIVSFVTVVGFIYFIATSKASNTSKQQPHTQEEVNSESTTTSVEVRNKFRICFTGDNNLATYSQGFHAGVYPYKYVEEDLKDCELFIMNLENNLSTPGTGAIQPKGYNFRAPMESLQWMTDAGVDVVSLANNHSMDFGPAALVEQMSLLTQQGIQHFGAGKNISEAFAAKYVVYEDTRIAFIGANDTETHITNAKANTAGSAYLDFNLLMNSITIAKQNADIVVVFPHWGTENSTVLTNRQVQWAQYFVDAGADIVVGAGPHVRQAATTYKEKPIYYSLGGFAVCGFYFTPEASTGILLKVDIEEKKIITTTPIDAKISFLGLPKLTERQVELYPSDEFKAGN